jgi:hypothetical protein
MTGVLYVHQIHEHVSSKHRIYTITLMKQNKTTDDLLDKAKSVNTLSENLNKYWTEFRI